MGGAFCWRTRFWTDGEYCILVDVSKPKRDSIFPKIENDADEKTGILEGQNERGFTRYLSIFLQVANKYSNNAMTIA